MSEEIPLLPFIVQPPSSPILLQVDSETSVLCFSLHLGTGALKLVLPSLILV